jgi:hypothetical protein
MKTAGLAIVLILILVAGIAVVWWFNHAPTQPIQQEGLTSATSATSTPPSGLNGVVSTPSSTATPLRNIAWATFTNPQSHYSIQYPTQYGAPEVSTPDSDGGVSLGWPNSTSDLLIYIAPLDTSTLQWLSRGGDLTSPESVSVNGVPGVLYTDPFGNKRAILNSTSTPYYIDISCNGGLNCGLSPSLWKPILDSFKAASH